MSQITTFERLSGPGSGTVTSVTGGVGINITGVPTVNPTVNLNVPVIVANGGTGKTTFTPYAVITAGTTATGPFQNVVGVGTLGQFLQSQGAAALPQWVTDPGAAGASTFHTDSGDATAAANAITIHGTHGINTSGAASTVTVAINNAITLGDLASIVGSDAITLTTGDITIPQGNIVMSSTPNSAATMGYIIVGGETFLSYYPAGSGNIFLGAGAGTTTNTGTANIGIGQSALDNITTASRNIAIGEGTMDHLLTGTRNVVVGYESFNQINPSNDNTGLGYQTGFNQLTGDSNTYVGSLAGSDVTTGSNNICVGFEAGVDYTTSESSNIIIGNVGTIADNNTIRIGTQGSGAGQQNKCFVAGITGVTVSNQQSVVINTSTGQLGAHVMPGPSMGTYTSVNHAASPYTVQPTDYYISCDVTGGVITILLPNAPLTSTVFAIKDRVGLSATSNITVTTVGGAVNIDGATTFVFNTAYESISVIFNGSAYEVF
jgi:hypothetical protein